VNWKCLHYLIVSTVQQQWLMLAVVEPLGINCPNPSLIRRNIDLRGPFFRNSNRMHTQLNETRSWLHTGLSELVWLGLWSVCYTQPGRVSMATDVYLQWQLFQTYPHKGVCSSMHTHSRSSLISRWIPVCWVIYMQAYTWLGPAYGIYLHLIDIERQHQSW
jgi:hypothetical protein